MSVDEIIDGIIEREGGYSNRAADRGGPTKYGITAKTLGAWRKLDRPATPAEVNALELGEARTIYRSEYVAKPGFDAIGDDLLRSLVVDIAVNSGPTLAAKMLQRAVGVADDGIFGPASRAALARVSSPRAVFVSVWRQRQARYIDIALNEPDVREFLRLHPKAQLHNLRGWLNRNTEFVL